MEMSHDLSHMRPLLKMLNQICAISCTFRKIIRCFSFRAAVLPSSHGSYEPDEESCGRLYHYRTVGKESTQRGIYYGKANAIASSADKTFSYIPDCSDLPVSEDADYVYICENNTIYGTKVLDSPEYKGKTVSSRSVFLLLI